MQVLQRGLEAKAEQIIEQYPGQIFFLGERLAALGGVRPHNTLHLTFCQILSCAGGNGGVGRVAKSASRGEGEERRLQTDRTGGRLETKTSPPTNTKRNSILNLANNSVPCIKKKDHTSHTRELNTAYFVRPGEEDERQHFKI